MTKISVFIVCVIIQEQKNLLYYYPEDVPLDNKIKDIGLCEALVKFTKTFAADKPCETLHTQKTRQLFLEVEENHWIILVSRNAIYIQIHQTLGYISQEQTHNHCSYGFGNVSFWPWKNFWVLNFSQAVSTIIMIEYIYILFYL